jgi:hypothetical protein
MKTWLGTLPGLVVCGGRTGEDLVRDVWRLDLATLRWEPMPALVTARQEHACCAVRGALVVLGGRTPGAEGHQLSSEVEILSSGAFVDLPQLSRGGITGAAAIEVDESDSDAGQVLYSEDSMLTTFCRRCTLWIWPQVRVRDSLTSSTRAFIMPRLGCRMGVSSAREVSMNRRRRCGARRVRGG